MEVMTIVVVSSLAGFVAGYGVRAAISRRRRLRFRRHTRLFRLVQARGEEEGPLSQQKAGGSPEEGPLSQQKQEEKANRDEYEGPV
jgi:hypothetical protein